MIKRMKTVYTIGYEGRDIDELIDILNEYGIKRLIDVRANGWSWKSDFKSHNLRKILNEEGIEYINMKALGTPSNIRKRLKETHDYVWFFSWYRKHLSEIEDEIKKLADLAENACLMCVERDYRFCHRSVLAEELERRYSFRVVHL